MGESFKNKALRKAGLLPPHDGVGEIVHDLAFDPSPADVAAAVSELAPVVAQSNERVNPTLPSDHFASELAPPLRSKRARKAK